MYIESSATILTTIDMDLIKELKKLEDVSNPNLNLDPSGKNAMMPIRRIFISTDKAIDISINGTLSNIATNIELFAPISELIVKTAGANITCNFEYGDIVLGRKKESRRQIRKTSIEIGGIIQNVAIPDTPTEEDITNLQNQIMEQIRKIKLISATMEKRGRIRDSKRAYALLNSKLANMRQKLIDKQITIPETPVVKNNPLSVVEAIEKTVSEATVVSGPPILIEIWNE